MEGETVCPMSHTGSLAQIDLSPGLDPSMAVFGFISLLTLGPSSPSSQHLISAFLFKQEVLLGPFRDSFETRKSVRG